MTGTDDRGDGADARLARDGEMAFRITARRNRLAAHWAAARMALTPEETDAYAKAVVQADFEGADDEDVVRRLMSDLLAAGVEADEAEVRRALDARTVEARRQLMEAR